MLISGRMLPIKAHQVRRCLCSRNRVKFDRCVEGIATDYWKLDLYSIMARVLLFLLSVVILLNWVQRISGADSTSILDMLGK